MRYIIATIIIIATMTSCASSRIVLSDNANLNKYKYVIFGNETTVDRELDDVMMEVRNLISRTGLRVLSASDATKMISCSDSILTPNINVNTEKWDGGHTYITITFYDYANNQPIAVVKGSGIGLSLRHDQNIALGRIKKKLHRLFKQTANN